MGVWVGGGVCVCMMCMVRIILDYAWLCIVINNNNISSCEGDFLLDAQNKNIFFNTNI